MSAPVRAWEVEHVAIDAPGIVLAESRNRAKYCAARSFWDAYGKGKSWPNIKARRAPEFDLSPLKPGRVVSRDFALTQ